MTLAPQATRRHVSLAEEMAYQQHQMEWLVSSPLQRMNWMADADLEIRKELSELRAFKDKVTKKANWESEFKLDVVADLTSREMDVLIGMSEGLSNAQIGYRHFISEDTVKTHARRLFRKIGAKDRANAVAIALRGK